MRRREFIAGGLAGGAALAFARRVRAQAPTGSGASEQEKLARLSVMTYCFDSLVKGIGKPDDPNRTLDILDAPQMIADHYGIHHVEMQHTHFQSNDKQYFQEMRDRLKKAGSQLTQICLEFDFVDLSSKQKYQQLEMVDLCKTWIDYCGQLGCPRVLLNQGGLTPDSVEPAKWTLRQISDYAKTKNVFCDCENRGGGRRPAAPAAGAATANGTATAANGAPTAPGANAGNAAPAAPAQPERGGWEVLVEVLKAGGGYANPDIGNFSDEESRAAGLRVMYTMTSGNSHAHYAPDRYDEAKAIAISKEAGYKGLFSIETGRNNGPDPYTNVQTVRDALLQYL
jgi:xylose isomerase-like TIM barrel protein